MADIQKLNVNNTTYDISTTWDKVTGKPTTFPPASHQHEKITHTLWDYYNAISDTTSPADICANFNVGHASDNALFTGIVQNSTGGRYQSLFWTGYGAAGLVELSKRYGSDGRLKYRVSEGWSDNGAHWSAAGYRELANIEDLTWNNVSSKPDTATRWPSWSEVTNKPSSFTPSSHTHTKSQITDFPSSMPASDVYSWAKASTKPTYTYSEVGAAAASHNHTQVLDIGNSTATTFAYSKSGLGYDDYSWLAGWNGHELRAVNKTQFAKASHGTHLSGSAALYSNSSSGSNCNNVTYNLIGYYTSNGPSTSLGASTNDGSLYSQAYSSSWVSQIAQDYRNGNLFTRGKNNGTWTAWKAVSYNGHTHTKSQITDFPSSMPASDVYAWAKASTKPTYTADEVGAATSGHTHSYLSGRYVLLNRASYVNSGLSFYGSSYNTWQIYMSNAGQTGCGVNGNVTAPTGSLVTSWGLRSVLENAGGYGWTWESMTNNSTTPTIQMELSSYSGNLKTRGTMTATGFYQSSDERLKTFYDPIKVDLDKLSKLRKNYFKFKDKDKLEIGVSAQEIQSIYPEIVSTDDNGYLSVAYDKLSVIALAAIDELDDKILQLANKISTLENILNKLMGEKGVN